MMSDVDFPALPSNKNLEAKRQKAGKQTPPNDDSHRRRSAMGEWDFILPVAEMPLGYVPGQYMYHTTFRLSDLVGAVQHGLRDAGIRDHLGVFGIYDDSTALNGKVMGVPSIFYAVETNDESVLRAWVAYGGDVNATYGATKIPLLAYGIIHAERLEKDTTLIVATLLSLGADPTVLPSAFYIHFCRDLPENGFDADDLTDQTDGNKRWCTKPIQARLVRTTNLSQRYFLHRAANRQKSSERQIMLAKRRKAEGLLGIPYFLIGQTLATDKLMKKLLTHLMSPSNKPLVLVFAGPSGHGKTALARSLGHLLSLELQVVNCTIATHETDIFGPQHPYVGSTEGSPLNNFLGRKAGGRSIVFLDEFEKTTSDVHKAMLLPFDNGEYQDRRKSTAVDCSQTIWILATNALDPIITSFCASNKVILSDENIAETAVLMDNLARKLRTEFLQRFGAPITGRISAFIPFLPFSPSEQAVVAHKYFLELARKIRAPVNLSDGVDENLLGGIKLGIRKDATVCRMLAEEGYHTDLGARSLINAVKTVEDTLVEQYLDLDGGFSEDQNDLNFVVDVSGGNVVANLMPKDT